VVPNAGARVRPFDLAHHFYPFITNVLWSLYFELITPLLLQLGLTRTPSIPKVAIFTRSRQPMDADRIFNKAARKRSQGAAKAEAIRMHPIRSIVRIPRVISPEQSETFVRGKPVIWSNRSIEFAHSDPTVLYLISRLLARVSLRQGISQIGRLSDRSSPGLASIKQRSSICRETDGRHISTIDLHTTA